MANFTIASTPRSFDRTTNEWKDGEALFMRCSLWGEPGEHAAGSLTKGARVIAQGRVKQRTYETKEKEKRTVIEMEIDEIGPSLRYATAQVTRAQAGQGVQQGGGQQAQSAYGQPAAAPQYAQPPAQQAPQYAQPQQGGYRQAPQQPYQQQAPQQGYQQAPAPAGAYGEDIPF